jgi:hypothetical protein
MASAAAFYENLLPDVWLAAASAKILSLSCNKPLRVTLGWVEADRK